MHALTKVQFSLNLIVYYKNIEKISEILGTVRLHYKISIIKGYRESKYNVIKRIWKNERSEFLGVFSLFYPSLHTVLPTMIDDLISKKCSIAVGGIGALIHRSKSVVGIQFFIMALQRMVVKVCFPHQLHSMTNPVSHNFIINHNRFKDYLYATSRHSNLILDILFEHSDQPIIEYPLEMSVWNCFTTLLACLSRHTIQFLLRVKLTQIRQKTFVQNY